MRTPLLVVIVGLLGCADAQPPTKPEASTSSSTDAGPDMHYSFPCLGARIPTGEPTWTAIYLEIFCTAGCADTYCHGSSGRWADLDLERFDGAYAQLVGQPSGKLIPVDNRPTCAESTLLRVKPGAPEQSLLYLKISDQSPCGTRMPPPSRRREPLPAAQIEQVRRWIELGARSFRDE